MKASRDHASLYALFLFTCAAGLLVAPAKTGRLPAAGIPDNRSKFVVHEWGTFSSFSGANGTCLKFTANDRDLPDFVYRGNGHYSKGSSSHPISMETPVIYFYTDREMTASVAVKFPAGKITEWYPQATRNQGNDFAWQGLRLLPGSSPPFLVKPGKDRYYAARETDAVPLQITTQRSSTTVTEHEKFIFYRGVADFALPIAIRAHGNGKFTVKNTGDETISGLFLVQVTSTGLRFQQLDPVAKGREMNVQESARESSAEELGKAMVKALTRQGLYEKEARAMVKTWNTSWFGQEGTRLLYLVPAAVTDKVLPLQVEPRPTERVRVLVGRHDFLTPEREREIAGLVKDLRDPQKSCIAEESLNRLGRFRYPAQLAATAAVRE